MNLNDLEEKASAIADEMADLTTSIVEMESKLDRYPESNNLIMARRERALLQSEHHALIKIIAVIKEKEISRVLVLKSNFESKPLNIVGLTLSILFIVGVILFCMYYRPSPP
jgi:hypothetical protein